MPKTRPNAKCPCGSGAKYKKCCGSPDAKIATQRKNAWLFLIVVAVIAGSFWILKMK
jgi:hypothetical protein